MTFPAACFIREMLIGGPRGDKFQFIWMFWWVKHALVNLHQSPFFTNLQYYPTGVSLALHDTTYFWSFISVPLQFFLEPGVILNIFLLVCFPLNGLAFYLLAKEITKCPWSSMAGSVLFAYCPYFLGRFAASHIQYLGAFFIPLFLLELLRYNRNPRPVHMVKLSVYFSLTNLISFYYGLILVVILFVYFIYHLSRSKHRWTDHGFWRRLLVDQALGLAVAAIILLPFILPILVQLHRGDYQVSTERSDYKYLESGSGDLVSYFVPDYTIAAWNGWDNSKWLRERVRELQQSLKGNIYEKSVYPGMISWIVLIISLANKKIRNRFWPLIGLFICAFLFTLGPTLFIKGEAYFKGYMPAGFFYLIPIFNIIRVPTRFAFLMTLSTGIMTAVCITCISGPRRKILRALASCCVIIIVIAEFMPLSTAISPKDLYLSKFYSMLYLNPSQHAVLNIPVDFSDVTGGADIYEFAQTVHQKPIIGGYVSREPNYVMAPYNESFFLQAVTRRKGVKDPRLLLGDAGLEDLHHTLRKLNIRYVIVHKDLIKRNEWERVIKWLEKKMDRRVYEDRWICVYI